MVFWQHAAFKKNTNMLLNNKNNSPDLGGTFLKRCLPVQKITIVIMLLRE